MKRVSLWIVAIPLLFTNPIGTFAANLQMAKSTEGEAASIQNSCGHSPLLIEPPNKRQYYMGELSQKDLKNWPSAKGEGQQMPTPPNQRCNGR